MTPYSIILRLQMAGKGITFVNALAIAREQAEVYPARLAAMVISLFREIWPNA